MQLNGGEWSALCCNHFTSDKRPLGNHCIESWVVIRAGMDMDVKRRIPGVVRNQACHPVTLLTAWLT